MKVIVNGICGRMGKEMRKLADEGYKDVSLAAGADITADGTDPMVFRTLAEITSDADCLIDFSHHSTTGELMEYALSRSLPTVIATTGQTEEELACIRSAAEKIPIFQSANLSFGIALLIELAKFTVRAMPDADIEIVEMHHNRKVDAPSGTALMIANELKEVRENTTLCIGRNGQGKRTKEEIGIHAIRMGNFVGEHEVIIGTDAQTITLKHQAHSRAVLAEGAVTAAQFLAKQGPGLYAMKDMLR